MKKILLLLLFLSISLHAQYQLKSKHLIDPAKNIGYVDSCANFWMPTWDLIRGGFYTNISKSGGVLSSWGTNKDMLTQSRNAYGLTRAYQMTGKLEYLNRAKEALEFMYEHAWDEDHGGWFNSLDRDGNPNNINQNKTAFYQHYALLGIAAYYEATGDTSALNWLMKGYQNNEDKLWDDDPQYFGYYDTVSRNWNTKSGKSFNATVDAITTHLLHLYLMTNDQKYLTKLELVAQNMLEHLVESMDQQAIGFAEEYNSMWEINENETLTLMGHVLKTAWCFARIYHYNNNEEYLSAAEKLIDDVLAKGYDNELGGPYKDYDRLTGEMQMWNNPDTAKAWWQMEQAVVAGLQMYELTNNEKYLQMADETNDFFMKYFVDHEYGEVYENRTRYGGETWGEHKGSGGKAGYHSIELGYYNYLYGNFFLTHDLTPLYYNFDPVDFERIINLNPVALTSTTLMISDVFLDGQFYSDFDPENRTLKIPAGVGGEFEVIYEATIPVGVDELEQLAIEFELLQNYPNPFNPTTTIKFALPNVGTSRDLSLQTNLIVYDILGREVATLVNTKLQSGNHEVKFDGSNLSSGVYFYKLDVDNIYSAIKKMMLIK
ncbi:MAG: AGE family epimerase/isomerase [Melioribacteraceae bacterium]|nr:MAG: AGE family epimerase/isomerase [Melioribacteraceae bacterium]